MPSWFAELLDSATAAAPADERSALEAAAAVRWEETPLGPPEHWAAELRSAVRLCLRSRFPAMVAWGDDLIMIYNEGYAGILGPRHPAAMGRGVREIWDDVWPDVEPLFAQVLGGQSTWVEDQHLVMTRLGFPEETYFTYSYSPLHDDDGRIAGVLDISTETTLSVLNQRRLHTVADLSRRLGATTPDLTAVGTLTVERLTHSADVEAAEIHLRQEDGTTVLLATTRTHGGGSEIAPDVLREVLQTGRPVLGQRSIVAPLVTVGGRPVGVIALEASRMRPFSEHVRSFLELLVATVSSAMSAAAHRAAEIGELRRVSETLQLSMLSRVSDEPGTATRYRPAVGSLAVGGDWFDVARPHDRRVVLVVGDCVGHGLDAATVMGQLRSAGRALVLEQVGPAATLTALDRFARGLEGADCTTVFCAQVDEAEGRLTYASAGHLPALLVRDGVPSWLDAADGLPLAVPHDEPWLEATVDLKPGDVLVAFTDGLVERRGESLDVGLDDLAQVATAFLAGCSDDEPEHALADRLLQELLPHGASDDVALIVHRFAG